MALGTRVGDGRAHFTLDPLNDMGAGGVPDNTNVCVVFACGASPRTFQTAFDASPPASCWTP